MKEVHGVRESRVLWMAIILCTVYQSYRYPLQVNSSGTSPTYSDTPFALQAGKYLLAAPLLVAAAIQCFGKIAPLKQWFIAFAVLLLSSFALLKGTEVHDGVFLELSYWLTLALVLAWSVDTVQVSSIDRYFKFLLIYALASTIIEVALFITIGRLPALAFEGSLSVRFGGFLDDPNGFAAILLLLLGWSYWRFKGLARLSILGSIVVALLLTQSWTALGFLALLVFVWISIALSKRPLPAVIAVCACTVFTFVLANRQRLSPGEFLENVLLMKQGSISDHSFPWEHWASQWTGWALLGDSTYNPYESWWAGALVNFGVIWYMVFLGVIGVLIFSLRDAFSKARGEARPIYLGLLILGCYFVFGSFNLPFPRIFPVNFIFYLFGFLAAFGKIQYTEFASSQPVALPLQYSQSESSEK
jgi:hypothetical protein